MAKKGSWDVLDIVADWLDTNDYDGLFCPGECGCKVEDLAPCCEINGDCTAGYLQPCDCGEHDFHIGLERIEIKK